MERRARFDGSFDGVSDRVLGLELSRYVLPSLIAADQNRKCAASIRDACQTITAGLNDQRIFIRIEGPPRPPTDQLGRRAAAPLLSSRRAATHVHPQKLIHTWTYYIFIVHGRTTWRLISIGIGCKLIDIRDNVFNDGVQWNWISFRRVTRAVKYFKPLCRQIVGKLCWKTVKERFVHAVIIRRSFLLFIVKGCNYQQRLPRPSDSLNFE